MENTCLDKIRSCVFLYEKKALELALFCAHFFSFFLNMGHLYSGGRLHPRKKTFSKSKRSNSKKIVNDTKTPEVAKLEQVRCICRSVDKKLITKKQNSAQIPCKSCKK